MRRFLALTRREAANILLTPSILFATAFFVLLDSFAFHLETVRQDVPLAVFDSIALFMLFSSIILYPIVSMHSFADDNASGTLETLLTAPISAATAVLAKFSGCMVFVLIHLSHGLVYVLLLSWAGNVDWPATAASFVALFLFGCFAMSLGVFVSALTLSSVAAAAGSGGFLLFMVIAADLDPYSGAAADALYSASFLPHAKRLIAGQLDTRGLVFFLSAAVLFLFYAWLAVTFRTPEKRSASPTVRRRLTVTYLLVAAGFLFLLLQAAVLHVNGFWESGMPLGPNLARVPRLWFLPILFSAGSFVWSFFTYRAARRAQDSANQSPLRRYATLRETQVMRAPRNFFTDNLRARRGMAIAAVAALVIVVNLNWLTHYPFRTFAGGNLAFLAALQGREWDLSQDGRNSLSAGTRRILDTLQGRVQIYSFLPAGLDVNGVPVAAETRRLLESYSDYNALVFNTFADAVREPELAERLAGELEVTPEDLANLLLIDYQGRRSAVPVSSLAAAPDWRQQLAGDDRWFYDGERGITQAIMRLADPRVPTLVFTYGHLEQFLSGGGPFPDRAMSRFVRALAGANMRVRQHAIDQSGPIPEDCDVLVVASPRMPFTADDVLEVRKYLDNGGNLLVFAPPGGPEPLVENTPLNDFLFELGGSFRDDVVEDAANNDQNLALAVLGRSIGGGENTARMVFPLARTIRDNPRSVEGGWTAQRMVETFPAANAAAMPDAASTRSGPFTLVYRATRDTAGGQARAVVFASGRIASDADIGRGHNEALVLAMTQWLAGREESEGIAPRVWVDRRLTLTGVKSRAIVWAGMVLLPLAWVMAGVTVWWLRRD